MTLKQVKSLKKATTKTTLNTHHLVKQERKVVGTNEKKIVFIKSPNNCEFKRGNNNNIDNIEIKT
jgi:hypothetical protein